MKKLLMMFITYLILSGGVTCWVQEPEELNWLLGSWTGVLDLTKMTLTLAVKEIPM